MSNFNFNIKENWETLKSLNNSVRNIDNLMKKHRTKVYLTLTSSPLRLKYVPLMLSFLDLTHVYQIHINLPRYYRNKKNETYKESDINYLKSLDSRIRVYRPPKDLGPITKVLPTLKRIKDKNSIIISLDDDIGYYRSQINELIYHSFRSNKSIYGGEGFVFGDYEGSDFNRKLWPGSPCRGCVDILEGWAGIAYPKWVVTGKMLDRMAKNSRLNVDCKLSDDLIISEALAYYGINRRVINSKYYNELPVPFHYGELGDALHKGSGVGGETSEGVMDENMAKYDRCINTGFIL